MRIPKGKVEASIFGLRSHAHIDFLWVRGLLVVVYLIFLLCLPDVASCLLYCRFFLSNKKSSRHVPTVFGFQSSGSSPSEVKSIPNTLSESAVLAS